MVDTRDLKSLGQQCLYEFESRPRHKKADVSQLFLCLIQSPTLGTHLFSKFVREKGRFSGQSALGVMFVRKYL